MYEFFIKAILKYRWLAVALVIGFTAVSVSGLKNINVVSDYKSFVDPKFPGFIELEEIEATFTENQNLLVAIAPRNGDIFTAENIAKVHEITEQLWLVPYAYRVDSLTNFQHTQADGDDLIVGDLFPADVAVDSALIERGREFALTEPMMKHNLLAPDFSAAVVGVLFEIPDSVQADAANAEILTAVEGLLAEAEQRYPGTEFYLSGMVPIDHSMSKYGKRDNATLIPGMLLLMAVILGVMTRSVSGVVSASAVVIITGIGTMGLLGLGGWTIDPGSAISPIVIMTLAVADSVHIVEGVQKGMRMGMAKLDAIGYSLRENFVPVFLTSLTTVMGVATFTFAELPSQQRIGVTVALGVTVAFILSVTLLPALLAIFPMRVSAARRSRDWFAPIGEFSIRYAKSIVVVAFIISAVLIALAPLNKFNDSPGAMLASWTPEREAADYYEKNISGIIKFDVAVFADEAGGVSDPAYLAKVDEFVSWLRARDNIDHVATLTDTFKRLNQNMHGGDPEWYRLPEQQDLAAQYLLLYEMSLPYGLSLDHQLNLDKSGIRMTAILGNADSEQVVRTKWAIEDWFRDNAPELKAVVTGTTALVAQLSYIYMIPSMMKGGAIAMLMVSLVLFGALRSFKLGMLGVLANIIPVAIGYGVWYIINGQVNFIVASVAGVCLGVVVDFAVHFLSKYRRERLAGNSTEVAIRNTYAKVARPLWTTMVVLVAGFWLLMLSPVTFSFSMGYLTGIIIILALVFDFLVLPAMLKLVDRKP